MSCEFTTPKQVLDKVIAKGFANQKMEKAHEFDCECGQKILMDTYAYECITCKNMFAVTPCHADDISNIVVIKKN